METQEKNNLSPRLARMLAKIDPKEIEAWLQKEHPEVVETHNEITETIAELRALKRVKSDTELTKLIRNQRNRKNLD